MGIRLFVAAAAAAATMMDAFGVSKLTGGRWGFLFMRRRLRRGFGEPYAPLRGRGFFEPLEVVVVDDDDCIMEKKVGGNLS